MTEQSPNKKDLEQLIENYAHIIDGLDKILSSNAVEVIKRI